MFPYEVVVRSRTSQAGMKCGRHETKTSVSTALSSSAPEFHECFHFLFLKEGESFYFFFFFLIGFRLKIIFGFS